MLQGSNHLKRQTIYWCLMNLFICECRAGTPSIFWATFCGGEAVGKFFRRHRTEEMWLLTQTPRVACHSCQHRKSAQTMATLPQKEKEMADRLRCKLASQEPHKTGENSLMALTKNVKKKKSCPQTTAQGTRVSWWAFLCWSQWS